MKPKPISPTPIDQLQPTNCLGILRFARHYFCRDLEARGRLYVRHNFLRLMRDGSEFVHLEPSELLEILGDDVLNVKSEEFVFEAIRKWVAYDAQRRKEHLPMLIRTVRLGTLNNNDFVLSMMAWAPVRESEARTPTCLPFCCLDSEDLHNFSV